MRVLMLDPSGSNPYGVDLSNALFDRGVNVLTFLTRGALSARGARGPSREIAPRSCRGKRFEKAIEEVGYIGEILRACLTWKPDIIHVQWLRFWVELPALRALGALRTRIVITAHNPMPHEVDSNSAARYQRYYGIAKRLIVHESGAAVALSKLHGIPPAVIDVIPHGVCALPPERLCERASARSELGLTQQDTVFLFYGAMRPYKGYMELLRAFRACADADRRTRLLLAGWGSDAAIAEIETELRGWGEARRAQVQRLICRDGFVADKATDALFAACDCVVLPYREISGSSVLAQAFSYGRPVLATAVGGFLEAVVPEVNGLLVQPDDPGDLARALIEVAGRRDDMIAWGRNAKDRALSLTSWPDVAERTLETYVRAVSG
jgi:glycosyltransferase involved in cell wall biosynthesis